MPIVLGLLVALTYGTADFLGGLGSKRTPTVWVLFVSQGFSLLVMIGYLALWRPAIPPASDLALAVVAGAFGLLGIAFQYRALALGPMGVVAPVAAIGSAVLPVVTGLATGERPGSRALLGVVFAVVSVVVLGRSEVGEDDPTSAARRAGLAWWQGGIATAVVAGLCFGAFFALFGSVGQSSGLWPVVLDRVVSVVMVGAALVWLRTPAPAAWRPGIGLLLACGIFDVSAHSLYVFAGHDGLTSEVAVLSALYPATTVVLAVIVLRERLRPIHVIGLALAGIGVSLIALS